MKFGRLVAMAVGVAFFGGLAAPATAQKVNGVTDTEILLGTHLVLTGPVAVWGVPMQNGHIMRIEEQNAKGGVHGRKIRLIVEDNGYDPKKGVLAAQKLIQRDKVFAIVGPLGTPVVLASMQIVLDSGTPHLFPGSPHKRGYTPFHRMKFSLATPYDDTVKAGVKYFAAQGRKRIAIIYQDDEFGKEIRDAAREAAEKSGAKVVAMASFKRGSTAFSSQVARVRRNKPDFLVIGAVVRGTVAIAKEMAKVGWKVDTLVPASGCNVYTVILGKATVEGFYVLCQYLPLDEATATPKVKAWMAAYKKRFGKPATVPAAMGYDMQDLVILALERAGRDLTTDKFIAALESIKDYQDIFGSPPLTFGPKRRLGTNSIILTRITKGKFVRALEKPLTQ